MAIKKKSIAQIAKENKLDISEENAQRVADAYIQPTLDKITTAEQNAVADTQTARKALESNYFDQYRNTQYNAQSRGLTGGLASLAENRLRMQMGSANTNLTNNLLRQQAEFETERGTALSNAKQYKTNYLNEMLQRVQALREQDYQQRYQEWYAQQQLALQRASLAQAAAASQYERDRQAKMDEIALQDAGTARYQNQISTIYNRYKSLLNSGDTKGAANYLANTYNKQFKKFGMSYDEFSADIKAASNYDRLTNRISSAQNAYNAYNARNIGQGLVTAGIGAAFGLPGIAASYAINKNTGANKGKNYYKDLLTSLNKQQATALSTLPDWYRDIVKPKGQ